jgi:putative hydrolase of the HAD superfamily
MIKAVLFDIYGTLIDVQTDEASMGAYELLSRYLEYKHVYLTPDQVRWFYHEEFARRLGQEPGKPSSLDDFRQHIQADPRSYPDDDIRAVFKTIIERCCAVKGDELDHTSADLSHLFRSATRKRMFVYPTIRSGLKVLREKYRLGIVSNAQEAFTPEELDLYGLREHFDVIVLSSQVRLKKPNPAIFQAALEKIGVAPKEVVFVGNDLTADIMGASAMGMKTILVGRSGYSIAGVTPDAIIPGTDIAEIARIIGSWSGG